MYKFIAVITIVLLILLGMAALSFFPAYRVENIEITEQPPAPVVQNDKGININVAAGSYNWTIGNKAICSDSAAPCELAESGETYQGKPGELLTYSFEYPPKIVTIRFWKDGEVLYLIKGDGTIKLPAFEDEYTISITPEWEEGSGVFAFGVKVAELQEKPDENKPDRFKPSAKLPATSMSLEAIAGSLFDKYLEHYKSEDVAKGEQLTAYKIEGVKFVKENQGSFIAEVTFSVQPANDQSIWIAGNGEIGDDNWMKNKVVYATITMKDDIYTLESFGTSP